MSSRQYSIRESINRILRVLSGNAPNTDDPNTLSGEIYSEDFALSNLAELLANSLPGESLYIPGFIAETINNLQYLDFDTTDGAEHAEGRIHWNNDDGTLEIGMPGGNVFQQVGLEIYAPRRCKNNSGIDITNGQLVYIVDFTGSVPNIALANADTFTTSIVLGMATEDIDDNSSGWITTYGIVRDVDTSGFTANDVLYLDTTDGVVTNVKPSAPNYAVKIGQAWRIHATEGEILVDLNYRTTNFTDIAGMTAAGIPFADSNGWLTESSNFSYNDASGTIITQRDLHFSSPTGTTMVYDNPAWDDIQVSISNIRVPASNAPTERLYNFGVTGGVTYPALGFAVNDHFYFDVQTSHAMELFSVLDNHIHFTLPNTTNIGDRFQFQLDVIAAGIDVKWFVPTGSPFTSERQVAANDESYHRYFEIANIEAANATVSTIYQCKLTRIAATADEYGSEVYIKFTDGHYRRDTNGSRYEGVK